MIGLYRYEMHMHTVEGSLCARSTIEEMVRAYHEIGFAGAVVTNHFLHGNTAADRSLPWADFVKEYSRCWYEGQAVAKELDFDLLFGVEESYDAGKEILVYGLEPDFLLAHPELENGGLPAWSKAVREAGGVLIYAHPFRQRAYIPDGRVMPDLSMADGVEMHNRCNTEEDNAYTAGVFADAAFIKTAGSDWHKADFTAANGIELDHRVRTGKELAEALKAREHRLLAADEIL